MAQTLGNWVNAWRTAHVGDELELSLSERARLKELERQVRELRMENEFLGKATGRIRGGRRNTGSLRGF